MGVAIVWAVVAFVHAWADLEREQGVALSTPLKSALLVWPWQLEAAIDTSLAHPGDTLTVTLRLDAPAQRAPLSLRAVELVGLEAVDGCWGPHGPDCAPGRTGPGEWQRAVAEARTAVLLVARLRVLAGPGERALRWRASASGTSRPEDLLLGPLSVAPRPTRWLSLERTFYATLRDLLWPGLAALLGFLLQNFLQRRSERQQVWSVIFPKAWANAQKHLLAVVSSAQALAELVERNLERPAPAWSDADRRAWAASDDGRGALYFALAMGHAMHRTRRQGGSLFLGSLCAEDMAIECWTLAWRRLREQLGRDQILPLFERARLWKSRASFDAGLSAAERSALEAGFTNWLLDARLPLDLALVRALASVMQFEVDAMCGVWYGETGAPKPPVAELQALAKRLEATATLDDRARKRIAAALAAYREALRCGGHFEA